VTTALLEPVGVTGRFAPGGETTLEEAVSSAWEGLTAHAAASCPVCDEGTMRPRAGGGATCDRCKSRLD
jgi:ribosomal protein L37AE/L43A